MEESVGFVETKFFKLDKPLALVSGKKLFPVTIAYETYGELNKEKSNAILICHAFSGDAHVAGYHRGDDKPGWWDDMVGPGRAFDTEKYFVICSNIIGGCKGSTGPGSINPATGRPYGMSFPVVRVEDMVAAQVKLIDFLGIKKLLTVTGGSMGGMQALEWFISYPERIKSVIPIATTIKHSPQQIAFNEVGRQAIMWDVNWQNGDYYGKKIPARGLALARMIGHITYMSDKSMEAKFSRQVLSNKQNGFGVFFEVENYLHYRGDSFVKRFDANSYLYITKAMDIYDASRGKPFHEVIKGNPAKLLAIAFESDWLYPIYQAKEIVKACKIAGVEATFCVINSTYGHDAFLLEVKEESQLISHFLRRVYNE